MRLPFFVALPAPGVGLDDGKELEWAMDGNGRRAREVGKEERRGIGDEPPIEWVLKAAGESGDGAKVVAAERRVMSRGNGGKFLRLTHCVDVLCAIAVLVKVKTWRRELGL